MKKIILLPVLVVLSAFLPDRALDAPEFLPADEPETVLVEGGEFTMGCTAEQGTDCKDDEKPAHKVTVSSYYIGKYEVTVSQFNKFAKTFGHNTDAEKQGFSYVINEKDGTWTKQDGVNWMYDAEGRLYKDLENNTMPANHLTYSDAIEYCSWLNKTTGKKYRLPTEAEWEFAARGGKKSKGFKYSGSNTAAEVAWLKTNSKELTHLIGQLKPNELGIYDMSGNVWEWTLDYYQVNYYSTSPAKNPCSTVESKYVILRGGSFETEDTYCRTTDRIQSAPHYSGFSDGFRVARTN